MSARRKRKRPAAKSTVAKPLREQLLSQGFDQRRQRRLVLVRIDRRQRRVDEAREAVPVRRVQRHPARQRPELRQHRVHAPPIVEIEQRQPELAPARNVDHAFRLHEAQCPPQQRGLGIDAQGSAGDVDQGGDEQVRRAVRVEAPRAVGEAGRREIAQQSPAPHRVDGALREVADEHVLRGEHGGPHQLALPAAVFALQVHEMPAGARQRGLGIVRCDPPPKSDARPTGRRWHRRPETPRAKASRDGSCPLPSGLCASPVFPRPWPWPAAGGPFANQPRRPASAPTTWRARRQSSRRQDPGNCLAAAWVAIAPKVRPRRNGEVSSQASSRTVRSRTAELLRQLR